MTLESSFYDSDKISKRVFDSFFNQSSLYTPSNFIVLLFGEYVEAAIQSMETKLKTNSAGDPLSQVNIENFKAWMNRHWDVSGKYLDLKWTCKSATLPTVSAEIDEDQYSIDTTKGIHYPLIRNFKSGESVNMTILEDKNLMMYQFFNALTNRFFTAKTMRPKSSFQKLGIVVVPLMSHEVQNNISKGLQLAGVDVQSNGPINSHSAVSAQAFEFNSAVLQSMGTVNLDNANSTGAMEYSVKFRVPNCFQVPFNSILSGLRNNTTDSNLIRGRDNRGLLLKGKHVLNGINDIDKMEYDLAELEVAPHHLKPPKPTD